MADPKEIISKVLEIIGYRGDRENYAERFVQLCEEQAILDMVRGMEEDKREELGKRVSESSNDNGNAEIFKEYFTEEEFEKALQSASEKLFQDYLETIEPTLTSEQKEKLDDYLASISK